MKLTRWLIAGGALYALYKKLNDSERTYENVASARKSNDRHQGERDAASGLAAIFQTRESADLAVEHLVQEHGVDRNAIFVEAVGDENSSGTDRSGGDHVAKGQDARDDGALNGALRLTVAIMATEKDVLENALQLAVATSVRAI